MSSVGPIARFLAPLALLATIVAVLVIYSSTVGGGDEPAQTGGTAATSTGEEPTSGERRETREREGEGGTTATTATTGETGPRTYRVRSGDTLGAISERTGVPVERLTELNPDVDAQSLTVGDTLRLRGGG